MARTPTPLHYYDLGTGQFDETTTYPFTGAKPTRFYLGAGNTLTRTAPASTAATDTVAVEPDRHRRAAAPSTSGRWAGSRSRPMQAGLLAPCANDDQLSHPSA